MRARRPDPRPGWIAVSLMSVGLVLTACSSSSSTASTAASKDTFCSLLVAFRVSNDSLDAAITSGDNAKSKAAVQRLAGQAKTLQQRAPSDIEPDVGVAAAFLVELDALFAKYDYDLDVLSADPAAVEQYSTINSDTVRASLDQLRAYGDTDCEGKTPPYGSASTVVPTGENTTTTIAATSDVATTTIP